MVSLLAHITPLEAPVVWLAFAGGLVLGILGTLTVLRRKAQREQA